MFKLLKTDEPLHFAWRMFFPPGLYQFDCNGDGGVRFEPEAIGQTTVRCAIRETEENVLQVFCGSKGDRIGSSSTAPLGDRALLERLRGRWNEVRFEQIGESTTVVLDPSKPFVALRLKLPANLEVKDLERSDDLFVLKIKPWDFNP